MYLIVVAIDNGRRSKQFQKNNDKIVLHGLV
jgi:hypothetical protein